MIFHWFFYTNLAKIINILNSFKKPGLIVIYTLEDDFYIWVASVLIDFKFWLKSLKAEMMPALHNSFFKNATFGFLGCSKDSNRWLSISDCTHDFIYPISIFYYVEIWKRPLWFIFVFPTNPLQVSVAKTKKSVLCFNLSLNLVCLLYFDIFFSLPLLHRLLRLLTWSFGVLLVLMYHYTISNHCKIRIHPWKKTNMKIVVLSLA